MVEIKHKELIDVQLLSNCSLLKLIADNELGNLWRRENPDSPKFIRYGRSSGTISRIYWVYNKINHIMVCFTNHYNTISIDRLPSKTKIGKTRGTLLIFFYEDPSSAQL